MTTKDEVLKLALDALINHEGNYVLEKAGAARSHKAIAAIKQALAEPVQQKPLFADIIAQHPGLVEELKAVDEQPLLTPEPVQESVAETEIDIYADHCGTIYSEVFLPKGTKLYTEPPTVQPAQGSVTLITPLMEQQMFDDWCPYKGNPDPRTVWASAIDSVNGLLLGATQDSSFEMVKDSRTKFDK